MHDAPSVSPKKGKSSSWILAAILFAATVLRLYGLNAGLWHDEILTLVKYVKPPLVESLTTYEDQNQHFLFTILAHASISLFGESNWALRLPAVLFGVGSIWALYLFGRLVSNEREALLSAALLAFSYHHIWFSQNARGYTGLLFWTILASWLLLRALHESKPKLWICYAGAAALGVYTNMTMLFVIVTHFILYLQSLVLRRKEMWPGRWTGFFLGFCLAGILTLLLHSLVLSQILGGGVHEVSTVPLWKQPLWTLLEFVKAIEIGLTGRLIAVLAMVVFAAGFFSYARSRPEVAELLVLPALVCGVVVVSMGHHLWPRFFFFVFGFGVLIVVRGTMLAGTAWTKLLKRPEAISASWGTGFCICLILVSALSIPFAYGPKQDFQGALDFVRANQKPDDAVVTVGLAGLTYKNYYKTGWEDIKTMSDLNVARSRAKRIWLLYTFPPEVQSVYPDIMSSIQRDFTVQKQFRGTVGGGTIFVCLSRAL